MNTASRENLQAAVRGPLSDHDAITAVMNLYNEGVVAGRSQVMKPAFHPAATFFGHYQGSLLAGSIQILFDWVDGNGACSGLRHRIASVDVFGTIAVVRVEMENLTGQLAGTVGARLSDLFQLVLVEGEWKITQKSFHWHDN